MLDLEQARARAATLADDSPTTVSGRWLRQVIDELSAARELRGAALDFKPHGEVPIGVDLSRPSGSFTALVASRGGKIEGIARL